MGSRTVNPVTPTLAGAAVTSADTLGTCSTVVVTATTAQSALNLAKLVVVFENYSTTLSCVITPTYGDDFSEVSQGNGAAKTLGTAATCVFGGKSFESARFLQSDGTIVFNITTAATCFVRAYQIP